MRVSAGIMMLDCIGGFMRQNSSEGNYKPYYKFYTRVPHEEKCHNVATIPSVSRSTLGFLICVCYIEKNWGVIGQNG